MLTSNSSGLNLIRLYFGFVGIFALYNLLYHGEILQIQEPPQKSVDYSESKTQFSILSRNVYSIRSVPEDNGLSAEVKSGQKCSINLAVVLCKSIDAPKDSDDKFFKNFNRQITQLVVLLKSIVLTERFTPDLKLGKSSTKRCVNVIVVANSPDIFEQLKNNVENEQGWDSEFQQFLEFSYVPAIYPKGYEWMTRIYRPCATIRLFLDNVLPDIDSVIYTDTDMIFLQSLQYLWKEFENFSHGTVAGLIPELNNTSVQKAHYNPTDYNTGVMLMNLTRMRALNWSDRLGMVSTLYLNDALYGDQDILILYFDHFPKQLLNIPCHWNFAPRNCKFGKECASEGISALHGLIGSFVSEDFEVYFKKVFDVLQKTKFDGGFKIQTFAENLSSTLSNIYEESHHSCNVTRNFGKLILGSVNRLREFDESENQNIIGEDDLMRRQLTPEQQLQSPILQVPPHFTHCTPIGITLCEYPLPTWGEFPRQINQTIVLLKSLAITMSLDPVESCANIFVFSTHKISFRRLDNVVSTWDEKFKKNLHLIFVQSDYPPEYKWMKQEFKRCATLRLFYDQILTNVNSIIHLDNDIIFTRPIRELEDEFSHLAENTILALAPQINYVLSSSTLFYRPSKYQAGVMLMNLQRFRSASFSVKVKMIATFFKNRDLKFPVQDILGIYFHHFPDQVELLTCAWNFLPNYCFHLHPNSNHVNQTLCKIPNGIFAIHGTKQTFTETPPLDLAYKTIFNLYHGVNLKSNFSPREFVTKLEVELDGMKELSEDDSPCGTAPNFKDSFLLWMKQVL